MADVKVGTREEWIESEADRTRARFQGHDDAWIIATLSARLARAYRRINQAKLYGFEIPPEPEDG